MRVRVRSPRFSHGLHLRLTLSYALFFTLLLGGAGVFFHQTLVSILDRQIREVLEQEWGAMKAYLRIEGGRPVWSFDRDDPDEAYTVERLRRIYLLADSTGSVMEVSDIFKTLDVHTSADIRAVMRGGQPSWSVRRNREGMPYLVRAGVNFDERHRDPYFVAIGRSLTENETVVQEFTRFYVLITPVLIMCGSFLGWYLAGRALAPVTEVARAAERISGSNLSLRIPGRKAGDELDYLIETFNTMIERLDLSFQQIRQFSTDVSHELRTPITAIRGQLEVALFNATTTGQYRDAIVNSLEDVERLGQIVRALLLLSQAESGQLALQKTREDLARLVQDATDQFQIPAEAAQVRLFRHLPASCPVEVDRIQIARLISNLLSNAVKFTPAGGEVHVSLERRADTVELEFRDTGCGIAPEHQPFIFDRLYRVAGQDPSPEKGLGLGLSFVAWIAKAHGGSVRVESEPGHGSRFVVSLPAPPEPPEFREAALPAAADSR
jgi:heavy metal sensor kinase